MSKKTTRDGYVKVSGLQDLFRQLDKFPEIDTVRYTFYSSLPGQVFAALWSELFQEGFGGCAIPLDGLDALRKRYGNRLQFKKTV
jgi:hypothetical protein